MPSYCENIVELDGVPPIDEMIEFIPYYAVPQGCMSIEVFIRVPNECYSISGTESHPPAEGACGNPGQLQQMISLNQIQGCTNPSPKVLSLNLDYCEDPQGHCLCIYTMDQSNGNRVGGVSKSKKKVHG
jgi:hypothetical protein